MHKSSNTLLPTDLGTIHFIGIGGIGMSGIAEILHTFGYKVQGSDLSDNYVTQRLKKLGITVMDKHEAQNIEDAAVIVKSTAIKDTNPEIRAAQERDLPIVKRSEMLAELMRLKHSIAISGTHGKTTTTSLVATLFEAADLDPTVINGGIINKRGSNAYVGSGDYLIAEADESDGTFIKVPSYVGVITNIDPEHLDYYGTFENAKNAFKTFIEQLPFYGFGVLCFDHPVVREIASSISGRRILTYGIDSVDVDFRATNITVEDWGVRFDLQISEQYQQRKKLKYSEIKDLQLGIHGNHNILNALSAIAIGIEKDFKKDVIKTAFKSFGGVKRRFTKTGEVDNILVIDDYAHHPVEITATLNTARDIAEHREGNVIAVMQPHRYTRLKDLMDDFSKSFKKADHVIIADVYEAGESPIEGISAETLIEKIESNLGKKAQKLPKPENLPGMINKLAKPSDIVVLLGAGTITKWAQSLPDQLVRLRKDGTPRIA